MSEPIPMLLWCPECGERHVDMGEFATKVHHTHACQSCGMVWRPAVIPTVGVTWLPGFKDAAKSELVNPQPDWIESSGRWHWPLPPQACFPGCCTSVVTASREWWEYAPKEAIPDGFDMAERRADDCWYWVHS